MFIKAAAKNIIAHGDTIWNNTLEDKFIKYQLLQQYYQMFWNSTCTKTVLYFLLFSRVNAIYDSSSDLLLDSIHAHKQKLSLQISKPKKRSLTLADFFRNIQIQP